MKLYQRLDKIESELRLLRRSIKELNSSMKKLIQIHNGAELTINHDVLVLSKHLQTTLMTLNEIHKGSASDVSLFTKKSRAVESNYLNQLARLDYLVKYREGRKV